MMDQQSSLVENTQTHTSSPQDYQFKASVLRRWVALLIDSLIVFLIIIVFFMLLSGFKISNLDFFVYFIYYGYFVLLTWKQGATLGKKWLKIRVVSANGKNLSFLQVFLREVIGKVVSSLVFSLGYLWAAWDKDTQAWHDKIAGTYVVSPISSSSKSNKLLGILAVAFVVFIALCGVLSVIIFTAINPVELNKRSRDTVRLSDFATIKQEIESKGMAANPDGKTSFLCGSLSAPCKGNSFNDGSDWLKADLSGINMYLTQQPVDPTNSSEYHYLYCSDGKDWEIDASLESNQYQSRAQTDSGDDPNIYELGTNLHLCPAIVHVLPQAE